MTAFALEPVHLPDDVTLWLDGNSKVTGPDGSFDEPVANSLSLPPGVSCPFSTNTCIERCYVNPSATAQGVPEYIREAYAENMRTMLRVLADLESLRRVADALAAHIAKHLRSFRWHISGDVMSARHAWFIDRVSDRAGVPSWIYTRSFWFLNLFRSKCLTINLSADDDNFSEAMEAHDQFGHRICYMATSTNIPDLPDGSVIFPVHELRKLAKADPVAKTQLETGRRRQMLCPADYYGQSDARRCGVCTKCL